MQSLGEPLQFHLYSQLRNTPTLLSLLRLIEKMTKIFLIFFRYEYPFIEITGVTHGKQSCSVAVTPPAYEHNHSVQPATGYTGDHRSASL